jgi:hypothetical protein
MLLGGALALGRGFDFKSHKSRCLSIFLIISGSSMNDKIFILPPHLAQALLNRVPSGKFNRAGKGVHLVDFPDQLMESH